MVHWDGRGALLNVVKRPVLVSLVHERQCPKRRSELWPDSVGHGPGAAPLCSVSPGSYLPVPPALFAHLSERFTTTTDHRGDTIEPECCHGHGSRCMSIHVGPNRSQQRAHHEAVQADC
jgi:hypothetical protein